MGQYYNAIFFDDKKFLNPHDLDNGAKLMEHSYIGNDFVGAVEIALTVRPQVFAWVGDYSDASISVDKIIEAGKQSNTQMALLVGERHYSFNINDILSTDYIQAGDAINLYDLCGSSIKPISNINCLDVGVDVLTANTRYLVNEDRREIVQVKYDDNLDEAQIHPLPLLTATSNGRGGGDYHGSGMDYVGSWAYNKIRILWRSLSVEYKDYTVINPNFSEGAEDKCA